MLPPADIAAYAAGLYAALPEGSWDEIATLCRAMGPGHWTTTDLADGARVWAMKHGANLSKLAADVRRTRRSAAGAGDPNR